MIDPGHNIVTGEQFRQIEDIIDARKLLGQYNVYKQSNCTNPRYAYSNSTGTSDTGRYTTYYEDMIALNDGNNINIRQTDSEITVVRVKYSKTTFKNNRQSMWDMHDIAIPGDGCHLGESPSLVNLVTLVGHNVPCEGEEYLVPLSSWEPYIKHDEVASDLKCYSETYIDTPGTSKKIDKSEGNTASENSLSNLEIDENAGDEYGLNMVFRRHSWAGKFSKFNRQHCTKTKSLPLPD